jgi:hypothetical protein
VDLDGMMLVVDLDGVMCCCSCSCCLCSLFLLPGGSGTSLYASALVFFFGGCTVGRRICAYK